MNFSDPRMMALLAAGGSLLQSSGANPRPVSMAEGLGNAIPSAIQGAQTAQGFQLQEMLQKKAHDEALQKIQAQEFMQKHQQAGTDPRKLIQQATMSGNPVLMGMAGNMAKALPTVKSTVKGTDANGNPVFHNVMSTGETMSTGITPVDRLMQVNQGDQITMRNPYTGAQQGSGIGVGIDPASMARLAQSDRQHNQSMGLQYQNASRAQQNSDLDRQLKMLQMSPEFQAQRAAATTASKAQAENQVKAQADLPRVVEQGEQTIKLVDDLLKHPGFGVSVGKSAPLGSAAAMLPGTQAASFDIALNQLKGKQFLEAFESLKGGGAITEIEGQKAQQAMSRMEKSNTEEEFSRASREFQDILRQGVNRAKMKAGVQPGAAPASSDGWGELR